MSSPLIDTEFLSACEGCGKLLQDAFRAQAQDHLKSAEQMVAQIADLTLTCALLREELAQTTRERDQIKESVDRVAAENRMHRESK